MLAGWPNTEPVVGKPDTPPLILASSSPSRRQLLARLGLAFDTRAPDIDETRRDGESGQALAGRLARAKAAKIAADAPCAIVIGADQVAEIDAAERQSAILGKPGTRASAIAQLRRQSGRRVVFQTGVCVHAPAISEPRVAVERVVTRFRALDDAQIARYVDAEDVTATAGSIKSEGLGITLVEAIESRDPSALIGLPLIALRSMLAEAGLDLP